MIVTTDTLFSLKMLPLFEHLSTPEIIAIASIATRKSYKRGSVVCEKDTYPQYMHVITDGKFESISEEHGTRVSLSENAFGVKELLFDIPVEQRIIASETVGAECFLIRKSNFFTIIHECPTLLVNYLSRQKQHGGDRVVGSPR